MSSNLPRSPCLIESDESCKCAARPDGLLNETQLRCRTLSTEHRRAIRCRTQGALGMLGVIYKRIAQVCTPTSAFLPYAWAQTIFCRNERWMERSKRVLPPPLPINFPALQKPSHTLYCLWLASTPKGPHYLAHFHRTQWGGERFMKLSCLIRWVQMRTWKHILSRTLVFSLKYLQSFCISAFVE